MTEPGPTTVTALDKVTVENLRQILLYVAGQHKPNGGGGASSINQVIDKKTPKKKKKPQNKEIERLKKKVAQDKAKLAQVRKDLRNKKLLENLEKAETKLKKEAERVRLLKEKLNVSTGQENTAMDQPDNIN